jgi:hypothetical protein
MHECRVTVRAPVVLAAAAGQPSCSTAAHYLGLSCLNDLIIASHSLILASRSLVCCLHSLILCSAQVGFGYMGQYLCLRVRTLLFGAMLRQEVGWFDMEENSSGRLNNMLSR